MKPDKLWIYLFTLSQNMWGMGDPDDKNLYTADEETVYRESQTLRLQCDKYDELMRALPSLGFNSVLIDLGNSVKYESHPEISQKEALSKDELKAKLDELRALGLTPIPKLNFSCGHNPWMRKYKYMVGTDEYYRFCDDLIDEVSELFDYPEYFHLGLDEEMGFDNHASGVLTVRAPHIWWRDAHKLFKRCEHNNARPWVWSDDYWYRPEEFIKQMPKSVLQSNWYYGPYRGKSPDGKYLQKGFQTYVDFEELGYDQVLTASCWHHDTNPEETFRIAKEDIAPERMKGVMSAPWDYILDEGFHLMMQDAVRFSTAKKKYFPQ